MIDNKLIDLNLARKLKYIGYHDHTTSCYVNENGNWYSLYYPAYRWDTIESNAWLKHYMNNIHICKDWSNPNYGYIDFNLDIMEMRNLPEMVSMPTYHEVGDWFRTKYGITISLLKVGGENNYKYVISYPSKDEYEDYSNDVSDYFETYKRAIEFSIGLIESHGMHRIENFGLYN